MTAVDQIKILDRKINQTEVQYDLDRKAIKISALWSQNLDKYEYLTGEDLDYQPIAAEEAKFEYLPLGRVFNNRGIKERLAKRVKSIEDKNEELLKAIKGKTDTKSKTGLFNEDLTLEAIALIKEIKSIEENIDHDKLSFTVGNNKVN